MCPGATDFQELKLPASVKADQWSWAQSRATSDPSYRVAPDFSPGWEGLRERMPVELRALGRLLSGPGSASAPSEAEQQPYCQNLPAGQGPGRVAALHVLEVSGCG